MSEVIGFSPLWMLKAAMAFLATAAFSVLFRIPPRSILVAGATGLIGWIAQVLVSAIWGHPALAAFTGAFAVGLSGAWAARRRREPATVFVTPGIVPLAPGLPLYESMRAFAEGRSVEGALLGVEAAMVAAAIAFGVTASTGTANTLRQVWRR